MHSMPIDFSNDAPKRLNGDAPSGHVKKNQQKYFYFHEKYFGESIALHLYF